MNDFAFILVCGSGEWIADGGGKDSGTPSR